MARGRGQQVRSAGDSTISSEAKVCPLCIEPLDLDEHQFYPCPCGYQVCVFCYDKLKLFCNNLCPGCRTEYGSQKDPYDPTVRQSTSSPEAALPKHTAQPQPDQLPPHQRVGPNKGEQTVPGWLPMCGQRTEEQPSTSMLAASAADTASAWPSLAASQRPAPLLQPQPSTTQTSASLHQQQQPDPSQDDAVSKPAGKRTVVPLPVPLDASQEPSVQADPEGAALLRTVQSAVGNGHLTIEEGTKQLVAFLRQREQAPGKSGSKASKPPPGFAVAANHASAHMASEPSGSAASDSASSSYPSQQHADATHMPNTASTSSMDASQATARSFQQWALGMASAQLPSSSSGPSGQTASGKSSTVIVFPVDMVAASASLWLSPATSDSGQLLSLRLHNHKDPPMLRKRRGPLYARSGLNGLHADQQGTSAAIASDGKLPLQQPQWLGLGNGLSGSHASSQPQNRNGFSTGFHNRAGQREHANGLPGNGSTSANSFSTA